MSVSERTVDGYRESLFHKFNVQSRVGLCLEAIRKEYVWLQQQPYVQATADRVI